MAENLPENSQLFSVIATQENYIAKPDSEFYSMFSQEEILEIISALEIRREIPLKYSYKGRGAEIWNNFYLKYITPKWYRTSSLEIKLLNENFAYINDACQKYHKFNVIDVGSGNSYPVKKFIHRLNKLNRIKKYVALDISEELLKSSQKNFQKWFPFIEFVSEAIDIEKNSLPQYLLDNQETPNIILHLGVTIANHQNRSKVFQNFKDSMNKNDLLIFTNEIGSNSQWDGKARGGYKYHVEQIYEWIKKKIGFRPEDCQLIRKYDLATDCIVANIKLHHNYMINFNFMEVDKDIKISQGEEITIWRHHKYEMPELIQEIEQVGLELLHYSTDKYLSNVIAIARKKTYA